ncbi:prostaglandin D2 receptor [Rana temporaria]|uniref:prostaglandin D2 receptor n=1 Tax=Rana temporaria TaxID=8407 RepID=UPI001AAD5737|nr:prostaglandin D2 receptor [Rana temporaria]
MLEPFSHFKSKTFQTDELSTTHRHFLLPPFGCRTDLTTVMNLHMDYYPCSNSPAIQGSYSVLPGILLFSAGVIGNALAIFILWQHKLRANKKTSVFYILVTGLTITNLMGKCLVSPIVLAAYSKNQTLVEMVGNRNLCDFFSFLMIFFGLAPMLILLAMGLDCWIALAYPFFYHNYITKRVGLLVPIIVYIFSAGFCSLPFVGFGKFEQYCPGTWCFIQMSVEGSKPEVLAYSVLYGTIMGIFVLAIIACNVAIMRRLYQMYQIQSQRNVKSGAKGEFVKQAGMEEMDHLILLAVMTVLFTVCSLPLTVRVYIAAFTAEKNEYADLIVLRFLSMNSIVDPWMFIICRTSRFHTHVHNLCSKIHQTSNTNSQLLEECTKGYL